MGSRYIRPTQFVTTYGAGSLIRVGNLHRVIPSISSLVADLKKHKTKFDEQDHLGRRGLEKFRILDRKMEKLIQGFIEKIHTEENHDIRIFKLPSNADMQIPDGESLYTTTVFPRWSICRRHGILARLEYRSTWAVQCPTCISENARLDSGIGIRFIRACFRGHMDDIDWEREVHAGSKCGTNSYYWEEQDNNFEVTCTNCGASVNYFTLKGKSDRDHLVCDGRFAETNSGTSYCGKIKNGVDVECGRLVLKNASNLRVPQVITSLLIPPYASRLYNMLSSYNQSLTNFVDIDNITREDVMKHFQRLRDYLKVGEEFFSVIENSDESEIRNVIVTILNQMLTGSMNERESEEDEFIQLVQSSIKGYPLPQSGEEPDFVVDRNKRRLIFSKSFGLNFAITPIDLLHVVKTQVGYRREVEPRQEDETDQFAIRSNGILVPTYHEEKSGVNSVKWFVGSKLRGEGIFIHVMEDDIFKGNLSRSYTTWKNMSDSQTELEIRLHTNPYFVWMHSLAHRLITDLSVDSGFQSTAINEKTYFRPNPETHKPEGGILLYAVQPGGDGTMGGLTGLVPSFTDILERSASRLQGCSNDPVCIERPINPERVNGAACHACMLISETSCGLQNKFLDRKLLLDTM